MEAETTERLEERLYDTFAEQNTCRDVVESCRIPRRDIILRAVSPVLKARGSLGCLVDVGCGIGATAIYLNGNFDRYVGIDFSKRMIEIGRNFTAGIPNVELIKANIKDPSLPKHIADVVFMDGALHHMTHPTEVVKSLKRLAKPGAWFVAREPQRGNPVVQLLRRLRMRIDPSYSRNQVFFSRRELVTLLESSGMDLVETRYQGYLTPPMALIPLNPQIIFVPLAKLLVGFEGFMERIMIGPLAPLSWNIVVYARFPGNG